MLSVFPQVLFAGPWLSRAYWPYLLVQTMKLPFYWCPADLWLRSDELIAIEKFLDDKDRGPLVL